MSNSNLTFIDTTYRKATTELQDRDVFPARSDLPAVTPSPVTLDIPDSDREIEQGDIIITDTTEVEWTSNNYKSVYVVMHVDADSIVTFCPQTGHTRIEPQPDYRTKLTDGAGRSTVYKTLATLDSRVAK